MSIQRERIVSAAAQLFSTRAGFAVVSMADIAESTGLTPGNLYRYVPGKDALLHEVFSAALAAFETDREPSGGLNALISTSIAGAACKPALVATYLRERRRIDATEFPDVARRDRAFVKRWTAAIREAAPHDSRRWQEVRLLAAFGALDAVTQLAGGGGVRGRGTIAAGIEGLLRAPLPPDAPAETTRSRGWQPPATRRQQIIDAAVRLFSERGYGGVRVTDVGKAIGIAGPSVYEYFRTKQQILVAAFDRCAALLANASTGALAGAEGPAEAIDRLAHRLAEACVANREIMAMANHELAALDEADYERVEQLVADTDDLWAAIVREQWPGVPAAASRAIARCGVQMTMLATRPPGGALSPGGVAAMTLGFLDAAAEHAQRSENDG